MKRNGFTLAEILITLGIIGVVAALTAPALVQNAGQAKIGPALSKFVNTFEVASETMMHEEEIKRFYGNSEDTFFPGDAMRQLSKYMVMVPIDNNNRYTQTLTGRSLTVDARNAYQLKDGSIMIFTNASGDIGVPQVAYTEKGSYLGNVATILVDIGGIKGKHRPGKEVFCFIVDNGGKLVPYGSNAYKYLTGQSVTCSTSGSTNQALACTGKVADNNWKADY